MDREVKKLKKSGIPIVKVRWNPRRGPELTWEREDEMKRKSQLRFVIAAFLRYSRLGISILVTFLRWKFSVLALGHVQDVYFLPITRHSSLIVLRKSLELKEQLAYYPSWKKWSVCSTLVSVSQKAKSNSRLWYAIKELKECSGNHVMIGANVDKYVVPTGRVWATVCFKVPTGRNPTLQKKLYSFCWLYCSTGRNKLVWNIVLHETAENDRLDLDWNIYDFPSCPTMKNKLLSNERQMLEIFYFRFGMGMKSQDNEGYGDVTASYLTAIDASCRCFCCLWLNGSDGVSVAAGVGADGVSVTSSDATDAETQFALMGLSPQALASYNNGKWMGEMRELLLRPQRLLLRQCKRTIYALGIQEHMVDLNKSIGFSSYCSQRKKQF
ncbi:hypothetical protein Tco_0617637 [Tanacetum coccineum]